MGRIPHIIVSLLWIANKRRIGPSLYHRLVGIVVYLTSASMSFGTNVSNYYDRRI
jgi:hypothetical protein